MGLFTHAARYEAENISFAMLQIIDRRGSTPLHSATMLVDIRGQIHGTIGGGILERQAIAQAQEALIAGSNRSFEARLTRRGDKAIGADCGGAVIIHIAVYPAKPCLYLLGAGHVNREVAIAAVRAGFKVTACDTWEGNLRHPELPESCLRVGGTHFAEIVNKLPLDERSYVVIATNHQDAEALEQVITLPLAYLGLLGSRHKVQVLRHRLGELPGVGPHHLAKLHAPLGIDIGAHTPSELAISIVAELIKIRRLPEQQLPIPGGNGVTAPGKELQRSAITNVIPAAVG